MAWNLFGAKKERSLGIDIGTTSIKIVELRRQSNRIELSNYGRFSGNSAEIFHSSSIKLSSSQAAEAIREILGAARILPGEATMSIPIFSGFSTVISLPEMSETELTQAITYEAKKYIPLPLQEVQFEWMKIESPKQGAYVEEGNKARLPAGQARAQTEVLVVAVTNELVNKYSEIAKLSGLTLLNAELDIFSLTRSLIEEREKNTLIIDIGAANTILALVERSWPVVTRSMDVAGSEFSKLLASSLGIDFARAEELKKRDGIYAGDGLLLPLVDSILMEGRRMIEEYARKKKEEVRKVILSGGSARMRGLLQYAVKSLQKESVIGFPFHDIIYPESLEPSLLELAPSFDVAVGLALRPFQ